MNRNNSQPVIGEPEMTNEFKVGDEVEYIGNKNKGMKGIIKKIYKDVFKGGMPTALLDITSNDHGYKSLFTAYLKNIRKIDDCPEFKLYRYVNPEFLYSHNKVGFIMKHGELTVNFYTISSNLIIKKQLLNRKYFEKATREDITNIEYDMLLKKWKTLNNKEKSEPVTFDVKLEFKYVSIFSTGDTVQYVGSEERYKNMIGTVLNCNIQKNTIIVKWNNYKNLKSELPYEVFKLIEKYKPKERNIPKGDQGSFGTHGTTINECLLGK